MNRLRFAVSIGLACVLMIGCPAPVPPGDNGSDGTGDVSDLALSYGGSLSGSASTVSSTGDSSAGESSRKFALRAASDEARAFVTDLDGVRLRDAEGNEYPDFPVNSDGSFEMDGLPVGVDIVVHVDLDGDGTAELRVIVNIPKEEDGDAGRLDGVRADPLSTLVLAKLYGILRSQGIDPREMGISPSALIHRIRDAFEHLLEESGIEQEITIDDLLGLSDEELAELFDRVIPPVARRGMDMARANIALAVAADVEDVVRAVAEILVNGGFAIVDDPQGIDLSFLGELANVEKIPLEEFMMQAGGPGDEPDGAPGGDDDNPDEPFQVDRPLDAFVYVSTLGEPDRNFVHNEEMEPRGRGPWFGEHVLVRMAQAYLDGRTIRVADLYRVIVDAELGMGARFTYFVWDPRTGGHEVFETADGQGVVRDVREIFEELRRIGALEPDPENFEQREAEVREALAKFLAGTAEPSFERVFAGILTERVSSAEELAERIRAARVHLPFSRSGPARFFVVATADAFRDDSALPVTVDVATDDTGAVTRVEYNPTGDGACYLGFGPMTDAGMLVRLILRRNGKELRDHAGRPQELELADETLFAAVDGVRFIDAFSESGANYPGAPALRVPNPGFDPSLPPDPQTNPPAWEIFVLMDRPGPEGQPVRVSYDAGVATADPGGAYYLMFTELTHSDGLFGLVSETGEMLMEVPGDFDSRVLIHPSQIDGATIEPQEFTHVFGIDAPNPGYDPSGAPYYDDIDGDGTPDEGEPTFDFRERLGNPDDWRSTRVEMYYRRADDGGPVDPRDVDWGADAPRTMDGVELVPRNFRPRLNAYRFGRPNVTINLFMAFSPPEFFDGTHALDGETRINPFMALALANLVFGSTHNVSAVLDPDGPGPLRVGRELVEAHLFLAPVGDPVQLMLRGFEELSEAADDSGVTGN